MAHVAKFTRGTCGLLARHYERYKDKEHPEEVKYKNQDIDSERTHLNYNLAPMREQMPYLKKRLEEVHCLNRDDVNVMCDWVVTAPKELPAEHQREFFETVYKHLEEMYGEKNVISAYVHMDENQPHLHFAFVPVVYDPKKKKEKVSAKEALNRSQLKRFHPELQQVIDKWIKQKGYDFECNVLNGATENGNRTIEELKTDKLIENRKSEASELSAQISEAKNTLKTLLKDVEAKKTYLGILDSTEINKTAVSARKSKLSKVTGKEEFILSKTDFANLIRTANLGAEINKKVDTMLADAKQKKSDADEYYKEKTKQAKWKSIEEAKAQVKKDSALENYQTMEKLFPDVFKEMRNQISLAKSKKRTRNHDRDLER